MLFGILKCFFFGVVKHYENLPMQIKQIFSAVKFENFIRKKFDIFNILAQNIDCGYVRTSLPTRF